MTPNIIQGGRGVAANATDIMVQGRPHEQGGVKLSNGSEVEGGENIRHNPITGKTEIDSKRLGTADINKPLIIKKGQLEQQLNSFKSQLKTIMDNAMSINDIHKRNAYRLDKQDIENKISSIEQELVAIQQEIEANFQQQQAINGNVGEEGGAPPVGENNIASSQTMANGGVANKISVAQGIGIGTDFLNMGLDAYNNVQQMKQPIGYMPERTINRPMFSLGGKDDNPPTKINGRTFNETINSWSALGYTSPKDVYDQYGQTYDPNDPTIQALITDANARNKTVMEGQEANRAAAVVGKQSLQNTINNNITTTTGTTSGIPTTGISRTGFNFGNNNTVTDTNNNVRWGDVIQGAAGLGNVINNFYQANKQAKRTVPMKQIRNAAVIDPNVDTATARNNIRQNYLNARDYITSRGGVGSQAILANAGNRAALAENGILERGQNAERSIINNAAIRADRVNADNIDTKIGNDMRKFNYDTRTDLMKSQSVASAMGFAKNIGEQLNLRDSDIEKIQLNYMSNPDSLLTNYDSKVFKDKDYARQMLNRIRNEQGSAYDELRRKIKQDSGITD